MSIGPYKNGVKDGLWKIPFRQREKKTEGYYKNGKNPGNGKSMTKMKKLPVLKSFNIQIKIGECLEKERFRNSTCKAKHKKPVKTAE